MLTDDLHPPPPGGSTTLGRWRVTSRINLLIGLGLLALAVLSGLYFGANVKLGERIDQMNAIQNVAVAAATARTVIVEIGRLQERLVERGDITVLADYNASSSRAAGVLRSAPILPRTSTANTQIDTISDGLTQHAVIFRRFIRNSVATDPDSAARRADMIQRLTELYVYAKSNADALIEFSANATAEAVEQMRRTRKLVDVLIVAAGAGMAFLFLCAAFFLGHGVSRSIADIADAATSVAQGFRTLTLPALGSADEIGQIARALDALRDDLIEVEDHPAEYRVANVAPPLAISASQPSGSLAKRLARDAAVLVGTATRLRLSAETLLRDGEHGESRISTVAAAAGQAARHADAAATAIDDLGRSLTTAREQMERTATATAESVANSHQTNEIISVLAEAPPRLIEVLEGLCRLSEETRLLGLNAGLEAARGGGQGGKNGVGVAVQLKGIARRSQRMVDAIGDWVVDLEKQSEDALSSVASLDGTITQLHRDLEQGAEAELGRQAASTREAVRRVEQMVAGSAAVADSVLRLVATAGETVASAQELLVTARSVEEQSGQIAKAIEDDFSVA
jgi:methyl-accepting chemotaxis protein